jgi:hypothetical protein
MHIEQEFDRIVIESGGEVLSKRVGHSPSFGNADYIFENYKLIAELKCIRENKLNDPASQAKFRRLWISWRQRGFVTGAVPASFNSRDLPTQCQGELYRVMAKPINARIQKANKQIRETKRALNLGDYTGVLFIANDGNFMFPPAATIHAIQLALHKHFREIRHFVFFTANMYLSIKGNDKPVLCWISFDMDNDKTKPAEELYENLYRRWIKRHAEITGIPAETAQLKDEDMGAFWFGNYANPQ